MVRPAVRRGAGRRDLGAVGPRRPEPPARRVGRERRAAKVPGSAPWSSAAGWGPMRSSWPRAGSPRRASTSPRRRSRRCGARRPETTVDYRVEDLLALSPDLVGRFDLVVEIFTLQALPDPPRQQAAEAVVGLVRPGGRLRRRGVPRRRCRAGRPGPAVPARSELHGVAAARTSWRRRGSTSGPDRAGSPSITGRAEPTRPARAPPAARRARRGRWRCPGAATRTSRRTG